MLWPYLRVIVPQLDEKWFFEHRCLPYCLRLSLLLLGELGGLDPPSVSKQRLVSHDGSHRVGLSPSFGSDRGDLLDEALQLLTLNVRHSSVRMQATDL